MRKIVQKIIVINFMVKYIFIYYTFYIFELLIVIFYINLEGNKEGK